MSLALTIADAMAARLNALASLPGAMALVDRQKDVRSEVAARLLKSAGAAAVILYEGFSNPDANGSGLPRVTRRYTLTLYARPIIRDSAEIPADDIIEIIARALHNWEPAESAAGFFEIHVSGGDLRPDQKYLIYDLDIEVLSRL